MCGRFTLTVELSVILNYFQIEYTREGFEYNKRYNIAPGQNVPVITWTESRREISLMRWGLIPSWAKEDTIGNKLINARAETIDQKPAFRLSFLYRRCLIPADGFYEWKRQAGSKIPMRIILPGQEVFAFAGIWAQWNSPEGLEVHSCSIITTGANNLIREMHDRMPVILSGESTYENWLQSNEPRTLKEQLLAPYRGPMEAYRVSKLVNSPKIDLPSMIDKLK